MFLNTFRHLFYDKCMEILVAVLQNSKSVDFTFDKVYSGIDLCMKIDCNSSPTPTGLTSISMFVPYLFHVSWVATLFVWWESINSGDFLKAWAICIITKERTIIRLYTVKVSMKMTVLISIIAQEARWQFKYGKNLKNECKHVWYPCDDRELHYLHFSVKQYMAKQCVNDNKAPSLKLCMCLRMFHLQQNNRKQRCHKVE